jgi:hypothetical protein
MVNRARVCARFQPSLCDGTKTGSRARQRRRPTLDKTAIARSVSLAQVTYVFVRDSGFAVALDA